MESNGHARVKDRAPRPRPYVWSPERIDALLTHLDQNKGPQGLYMTRRNQAYRQACAHVAPLSPGTGLSDVQVSKQFSEMWRFHRQDGYPRLGKDPLWKHGRQALKPEMFSHQSLATKISRGYRTVQFHQKGQSIGFIAPHEVLCPPISRRCFRKLY